MSLYPFKFAVGDQFTFENRHGSVTLEVVSDLMKVGSLRFADCPKDCHVTFDQMEEIALITDQVRLQSVSNWRSVNGPCAWILHATTGEAAWVKLVKLDYTTKAPAKDQIETDLRGGRNRVLV